VFGWLKRWFVLDEEREEQRGYDFARELIFKADRADLCDTCNYLDRVSYNQPDAYDRGIRRALRELDSVLPNFEEYDA